MSAELCQTQGWILCDDCRKQGTGGKDSQIYVNEKLIQSDNTISWIGNSRKLPEGVTIEGNLRIVTVEDRPFVFVIEMPPGPPKSSCNNATFAVCKYYNPGIRYAYYLVHADGKMADFEEHFVFTSQCEWRTVWSFH